MFFFQVFANSGDFGDVCVVGDFQCRALSARIDGRKVVLLAVLTGADIYHLGFKLDTFFFEEDGDNVGIRAD